MQKPLNQKIPLRTACLWIICSTLFLSGSAAVGLIYFRHIRKQRFQQAQYNIVAVVQTTSDKECLKTICLAELLNLSVNRPTNLFRFNAREAERILIASSLVISSRVKKILPGTIYVDYSLRKPVAYLLDYTNTVIDRSATAFPFKPFFTPKKLPEVYLGLPESTSIIWGQQLKGVKSKLALYLIDLIMEKCCTESSFLSRVDVSHVLADSYGQRQIVVIMENHVERTNSEGKIEVFTIPHILRLSVDNYRQGLANYLVLRAFLREKNFNVQPKEMHLDNPAPICVDLRIPQLAYISYK